MRRRKFTTGQRVGRWGVATVDRRTLPPSPAPQEPVQPASPTPRKPWPVMEPPTKTYEPVDLVAAGIFLRVGLWLAAMVIVWAWAFRAGVNPVVEAIQKATP